MISDYYDLTRIGFGELTINRLVRSQDISGAIPDFQYIKTLQVPKLTNDGSIYYIPHSLFINGDEAYVPVLERFEPMNGGGYATIYNGRRSIYIPEFSAVRTMEGTHTFKRASEFQEICIKSVTVELNGKEARATPQTRALYSYDIIQDLINESIIHSLIQSSLHRAGFPTSVPTLHEIVAMTYDGKIKQLTNPLDVKEIWITMEVLHGVILQRCLHRKFVRLPTKFKRNTYQLMKEKENELLLLDVCFQMSCYLDILQETLRFNHRDMKIDNAFCRYHPYKDPWSRNIKVPDVGTWKCKNDFVLIDFGSGCISCSSSCEDNVASLLASNSWFDPSATCLKYGRDMAQFLYGIHAAFPLKEYISHELFEVLNNAAVAVESDSSMKELKSYHIFAGIDPDGVPSPIGGRYPLPDKIQFTKGIYTFLKQDFIDVPGCRPKTLLQTLGRYAMRYKDSFITSNSGCVCIKPRISEKI